MLNSFWWIESQPSISFMIHLTITPSISA